MTTANSIPFFSSPALFEKHGENLFGVLRPAEEPRRILRDQVRGFYRQRS